MSPNRAVCCMIVILVTSTGPLRGQGGGDENVEKLKKLGDSVQALDPGKYKVLRWIEDQQARQANLKWRQEPVPAGHVYQIGQQYVVQAQPGPGRDRVPGQGVSGGCSRDIPGCAIR